MQGPGKIGNGRFQFEQGRRGDVLELFADDQQGMQLSQRTLRDGEMLQEFARVLPGLALGDVGGDGYNCPPELIA